jgi:radical SAM superfamily enzyme YgiQ (UPF0313 family)
MKVVLALPPFNIIQSYAKAGTLKRGILPPLGVGYLASSVEAAGHQVAFIDSSLLDLDTEAAARAILSERPDVIGLSCITKFAPSGYALAVALKARAPDIPIVMGGPHVTSFPDTTLHECASVDILIPGEGERPFVDVLQCLGNGRPLDTVQGLMFRGSEGAMVATPPRDPERNLDVFPHPARHIYQNDLYIPLPNQSRRRPATTVITSRGCPYGRCKFCYQGGRYASPYRRRSPENVVDEIARLARDLGMREIIFWDDNFCVNAQWIEAFCNLVDQQRIDMTWTVQSRVNTVTQDMLKRMAASGCYNVYFGLESGSQHMLDRVNKGITLEESRRAVKWARQAGMEIRGSFIFGMPGETPEIAEETLRFACELNVDWVIFYPYRLHPGTRLAEIAAREGTLMEETVDLHCPSYVPSGYASAEQLADIIRRAYRRYYLRPRYVARALRRAWRPAALKNYWDAFWYWVSLTHGKPA